MKKLNRLKRANGQIISVNEIHEKSTRHVKTYGIALKYSSRTGIHNIYKEYRDVSLNGAISQLHMDMAGNHRVDPHTIHILRTATLTKAADIRRANSLQMRDSQIKFPVVKTLPRPASRKFKTTFKANRPNLFRS